jgi:hypothetical protein
MVVPGDVLALRRGSISSIIPRRPPCSAEGARASVAEYSFTAARSTLFPLIERVMSGRSA